MIEFLSFPEEIPDFDTLISQLRELNRMFVSHGIGCDMEDIVRLAAENLNIDESTASATTRIDYHKAEQEGTDPAEGAATFEVEFIVVKGKPIVHRIIRIG